ncbi:MULTISPECIES: ABC transporter ATP-binding protein [unclassified Deinococcus]|jgi:iron(III) transport system ATP-binding protein|uniref:ABC transporter ATP-binding protein n=3 Tax=Deinococcus TaxID=1298 RepID=UPI000992E8A3|nr:MULTISPECIES: ABC transporter ATP-binding protein [unclassified Deinococcus]MCD0170730.1 ABC transporter ATP-binding protein [Deinococcus sp. 23YEL01]PIG99272.1 ABC transporter ATP-binding protein [Deinococcus sp. UR1]
MTQTPARTPGPVTAPATDPATLELLGLGKRYAPGLPPVVDDLNLSVSRGELLTLLGPSGCGKTTTLRLIAGLERPDSGEIRIEGRSVTAPFAPPERRGVGLVFQDYALFPHLNVLGNVLFGLRHLPRHERLPRARETLSLVGLTVFETRRPDQLSGGQQQRVALARALAPRPSVLLLDEPFSNLDAQLRHSTRQEVRAILRRAGTTAILVTHDQEEALAFSDRLVVMRGGRVEQSGPPHEVYARPSTAFVANFLGRSNLLGGTADRFMARTALGVLPLMEAASGPVLVSVRPEHLTFTDDPQGTPVTIVAREFKGHDVTYTVRLGNSQELLVHVPSDTVRPEGSEARVSVTHPARAVPSPA